MKVKAFEARLLSARRCPSLTRNQSKQSKLLNFHSSPFLTAATTQHHVCLPRFYQTQTKADQIKMENAFIGISGLIGAGKTTLATQLGQVLGLPVYYEDVIDNSYLSDFYSDMKKYCFPLQIYLLNKRFRQHQQIIWQGKGGVQDRTIYEDSVRLSISISF